MFFVWQPISNLFDKMIDDKKKKDTPAVLYSTRAAVKKIVREVRESETGIINRFLSGSKDLTGTD